MRRGGWSWRLFIVDRMIVPLSTPLYVPYVKPYSSAGHRGSVKSRPAKLTNSVAFSTLVSGSSCVRCMKDTGHCILAFTLSEARALRLRPGAAWRTRFDTMDGTDPAPRRRPDRLSPGASMPRWQSSMLARCLTRTKLTASPSASRARDQPVALGGRK